MTDALSVSDLNEMIASFIEQLSELHNIRCIGGITDLHQNSTVLYFTLTDGDAELPCIIWATRYRDMDAELEGGTEVILVKDATVQRPEAPTSIVNGIHHLDRSEDVDANTPVVTAIGHTDDRLIADQVADVATITPTAAGEYIVNSREDFLASEVEPLEQQLDEPCRGNH